MTCRCTVQRMLAGLAGLFVAGLQPQAAAASPMQSWLGLPEWVDFNVDYTAEPMAGLLGGLNPAAASWIQATVLNLTLSSGIEKAAQDWSEVDHWQLNLELSHYAGNQNFANELGAGFALQELSYPDGTWISESSIRRNRGTSWWSAEVGLISLNPDFLVTPATNNYINSTFNNTLNLLVEGLPINPFVAPGVRFSVHTTALGDTSYGYFNLDKENNIAASLGVNPEQPDLRGSVQVVQWSMNPLPARTDLLEPIEIQSNNSHVARQLPPPAVQLGGLLANTELLTENASDIGDGINRVVYATITCPMFLPFGQDNRAWIAGALGLDSANNPVPSFAEAGWLSQGPVPHRPLDVLALGISRSSFSPTLLPKQSFEGVIELNYAIWISQHVQLQPLMQWILNPSGRGSVPGIWATGLQLNLNL